MGINIILVVQKNLIPSKKPKNKGGSPKGVNAPPMFATRNIKKTIVCTLYLRHLFALIIGRIKRMEAPVVPIHDAKAVPNKIKQEFNFGVPTKFPFICIPPDIVNKENNKIIKGKYSVNATIVNSSNAKIGL